MWINIVISQRIIMTMLSGSDGSQVAFKITLLGTQKTVGGGDVAQDVAVAAKLRPQPVIAIEPRHQMHHEMQHPHAVMAQYMCLNQPHQRQVTEQYRQRRQPQALIERPEKREDKSPVVEAFLDEYRLLAGSAFIRPHMHGIDLHAVKH